jgi:hypothetical protein
MKAYREGQTSYDATLEDEKSAYYTHSYSGRFGGYCSVFRWNVPEQAFPIRSKLTARSIASLPAMKSTLREGGKLLEKGSKWKTFIARGSIPRC